MSLSAAKRVGVGLAAVAVVVGLAGCDDDGGSSKKRKKADAPQEAVQTQGDITEAIQAAFRKTSEAKSAKVRMTITVPAGAQGGGTVRIAGVQGWDPAVMDVTMDGAALTAADPDAPSRIRMIMLDQAMYMDMGEKSAAEMGGKRWMKLDLKAAAEVSGSKELQQKMTGGLDSANQDPAEQLALLLQSPSLKHVGSEKVGGVEADHYKGTLTFEEMVDANTSSDVLSAKEREALIANLKKAGVKGYDTEVWVNRDHYPVKMVVGTKTPEGTVRMSASYSDYGAAVNVQAPPAKDTVDLFGMLADMKASGLDGGTGLGG
ncbi:hypothetical protein ABZ479_17795 [Streptomyces sp. NPDC005722]